MLTSRNVNMSTFEELRDESLRNGKLFEDPDFPANNSVLYFAKNVGPLTWRRPKDIVQYGNPVFIQDNMSYYDINQGLVGDCFFLTAVGSLIAQNRSLLDRVVPKDQSFSENYAGIFRFNFWQYGEWKEVVVDDRLPMRGDCLAYCSNKREPNEFWICLLEKAYAKLRGNYVSIHGGIPVDALVDMTGGIAEAISLKQTKLNPVQLFKNINKMWKMDTMIALSITPPSGTPTDYERPDGLVEGHTYAVTAIIMVSVAGKTERLIRMRNPWGDKEWNGAWSDKSPEWNNFSVEDREEIGLKIRNEGEFWMSLHDVVTVFATVYFCHLDPAAGSQLISDPDAPQVKWSTSVFKDIWVKGASSYGRDINTDAFWRNPLYTIDLGNQTDKTWVFISLMEIMPKRRLTNDISIGFAIVQLKPGATGQTPHDVDRHSWEIVQSSFFREVTKGVELLPGKFLLVVYNDMLVTCEYLLRIYCERLVTIRRADDVTVPVMDDFEMETADPLEYAFDTYSERREKNVDASAMKSVMAQVGGKECQSKFDLSLESNRCLMSMADSNINGATDLTGVRKIYRTLGTWAEMLSRFDKNNSMSIETSEFMNMLEALGLKVGRKVAESVAIRYGGRNGQMVLDDIIQCICRLFSISKTYSKLGLSKTHVSLDEYISEVMRI